MYPYTQILVQKGGRPPNEIGRDSGDAKLLYLE